MSKGDGHKFQRKITNEIKRSSKVLTREAR